MEASGEKRAKRTSEDTRSHLPESGLTRGDGTLQLKDGGQMRSTRAGGSEADTGWEQKGGSAVKSPSANAGDKGSVPGSERFPWRRKWQPTEVFLPGKPYGRGAWRATVHGAAKSQT